ncbi:MAG: hypothetical protein EA421_04205 [Gemmatimonadales bacterium]|nr:MAG: hypothetical protein EA421_04205 [Gemmatimonadales bacterium]
MKGGTLGALKGLLWFVALSHVTIGLGIMVSTGFQEIMGDMYGASVTWTPELHYLLKPLGVFMLGLGVLGVVAARDPLRHRAVIFTFVAVLLLRVAQRVVHREEIRGAFELETSRMAVNGTFFAVLAVALVVLTLKADRARVDGAGKGRR